MSKMMMMATQARGDRCLVVSTICDMPGLAIVVVIVRVGPSIDTVTYTDQRICQ